MDSKTFYTTKELSKRWEGRPSEQTLYAMQKKQTGPNYIKIGGTIKYHIKDIEKYESENTHTLN